MWKRRQNFEYLIDFDVKNLVCLVTAIKTGNYLTKIDFSKKMLIYYDAFCICPHISTIKMYIPLHQSRYSLLKSGWGKNIYLIVKENVLLLIHVLKTSFNTFKLHQSIVTNTFVS